MKFVVSNTDLLTHLQAISKVINSKNTLPILDDFLFTITGNTLEICAADLETTMITRFNLTSVEQEGTLAIPAKFLLDLLGSSATSEQPLTFDIDNKTYSIEIHSETGTYKFAGHNADEFPKLPEFREELLVHTEMDSEIFANAFSKTVFATGEDEYRPVMSGILVEFGEYTTFVASDAHKLVRYRNHDSSSLEGKQQGSFIIHKKPASLLKNMQAKNDTKVKISFDTKNALFEIDDYTLICRLIDGKFPNYASVIPQNNQNVVTIDRLLLMNALQRVQVFADKGSLLMTLHISGNGMVISAENTDYSAFGKEELKCQYEGQEILIGFKSSFLIEILSNISTSEVQIQLSDNTRPGLILPVNTEETTEEILMLLMPMKI